MMKSSTQQVTRKNKPIIFLFGPTASGKTSLVEALFTSGYQIVNADSVQVYRHLDIGSAKPSEELMGKIRHHLVNILDPWQQFTVGQFIEKADEAVDSIYADGDIPLVTGGTAFYFKHFLYGLSSAPVADEGIRRRVDEELKRDGAQALYERLRQADPVSAARININDTYRITRALEVWYQSGRPLSSFALPDKPRRGMRPLVLNIVRDREDLYRRIEQRVDEMFSLGLVDEIRKLRKMGAEPSWPGLTGIGYAEFFSAFDNGCSSMDDIKNAICRNSRHYAKRQMTFFRSFSDVVDIHPDDLDSIRSVVRCYLSWIESID